MTKDDILALLGKQMQVRVTSNEKVEETLETASENDIILTPDDFVLYRHHLQLAISEGKAYYTHYSRKTSQEYYGEDYLETVKLFDEFPQYAVVVFVKAGSTTPILAIMSKEYETSSMRPMLRFQAIDGSFNSIYWAGATTTNFTNVNNSEV